MDGFECVSIRPDLRRRQVSLRDIVAYVFVAENSVKCLWDAANATHTFISPSRKCAQKSRTKKLNDSIGLHWPCRCMLYSYMRVSNCVCACPCVCACDNGQPLLSAHALCSPQHPHQEHDSERKDLQRRRQGETSACDSCPESEKAAAKSRKRAGTSEDAHAGIHTCTHGIQRLLYYFLHCQVQNILPDSPSHSTTPVAHTSTTPVAHALTSQSIQHMYHSIHPTYAPRIARHGVPVRRSTGGGGQTRRQREQCAI